MAHKTHPFWCISDQVLDHIDRPYAANRAVYEMLRPGGYFCEAVPVFARSHPDRIDCSRWRARGLKNPLIEGGFDESLVTSHQGGGSDTAHNDPAFLPIAWALGQKAA